MPLNRKLERFWKEFDQRMLEDDGFANRIPDGAVVFLLPESEPEICKEIIEEAKRITHWNASSIRETGDEQEYEIVEMPEKKLSIVFITISADNKVWNIIPAEEVLSSEDSP